MPEFFEELTTRIPIYRGGRGRPQKGATVQANATLVGYAIILDDNFGALLKNRRWRLSHYGYPETQGFEVAGCLLKQLHHIVFAHYHGAVPAGLEIDHEDQNKLNGLPENLRAVTRQTNIVNSGKRRHNTSGFKNVSKMPDRWRAYIKVNEQQINLGVYLDPRDAARAVNEAYRKYYPHVRIPNPEVE